MEKSYEVEVMEKLPGLGPRRTEKFCSLQIMKSANGTKIDLTKGLPLKVSKHTINNFTEIWNNDWIIL